MKKWIKKYRHKLKTPYKKDLGKEIDDFYFLLENKKRKQIFLLWLVLILFSSIVGILFGILLCILF